MISSTAYIIFLYWDFNSKKNDWVKRIEWRRKKRNNCTGIVFYKWVFYSFGLFLKFFDLYFNSSFRKRKLFETFIEINGVHKTFLLAWNFHFWLPYVLNNFICFLYSCFSYWCLISLNLYQRPLSYSKSFRIFFNFILLFIQFLVWKF
jgi:hypothetical protein